MANLSKPKSERKEMLCSYEYDQDPRYGWASIDTQGHDPALILVFDGKATRGFHYSNGEFAPVCICFARCSCECACTGVDAGGECVC